ncbi:hypothetical protein OIK44_10480 [Janthinobacterium sp. hw3]|uniref:Transposase n=1 Tax=Janthinobacterium fluminis TaxID=2987524 RepID=A0ABT5JZX2_9BURK|nr:hypothetical protein [Janthinobacterium fluminis]
MDKAKLTERKHHILTRAKLEMAQIGEIYPHKIKHLKIASQRRENFANPLALCA